MSALARGRTRGLLTFLKHTYETNLGVELKDSLAFPRSLACFSGPSHLLGESLQLGDEDRKRTNTSIPPQRQIHALFHTGSTHKDTYGDIDHQEMKRCYSTSEERSSWRGMGVVRGTPPERLHDSLSEGTYDVGDRRHPPASMDRPRSWETRMPRMRTRGSSLSEPGLAFLHDSLSDGVYEMPPSLRAASLNPKHRTQVSIVFLFLFLSCFLCVRVSTVYAAFLTYLVKWMPKHECVRTETIYCEEIRSHASVSSLFPLHRCFFLMSTFCLQGYRSAGPFSLPMLQRVSAFPSTTIHHSLSEPQPLHNSYSHIDYGERNRKR